MTVTLTCACGQRHYVAAGMAGRTLACIACGKALTVPAMGRLELPQAKPRPRPKPTPPAPSSTGATIALIAMAGLLLAGVAGGLAWWMMSQRAAEELSQIAQHPDNEPGENRPEPKPPLEEKKRDTAPERTPPELKAPPAPMAEPVKPREAPIPVSDLTKPVDLPKLKESPPVAEQKPANLIKPLTLAWKLRADDHFFQELTVTQKPNFKIQGIAVAAALQYEIVSRFTVKKANADGSLIIEQKVVSAKLLSADDLTKPTVSAALAKVPDTVYTLHLGPQMDVTKFEGDVAGPNVAPLAAGLGMQMTSLLDRDGWKELAQATFFQMDQPLKAGARWTKAMTHNWGNLGSWSGKIHYAYMGQQGSIHKVGYGMQLAYKAPIGGKIGLMAIDGAAFQPRDAGGTLLFDAAKGRVVAAEERFRVAGVLNVNLLGQSTPIEIDEDQHFLIRIHESLATVKK